jgi:hypothetical protein
LQRDNNLAEKIQREWTLYKVCLNFKFPPTLQSTLKIQPVTLFAEKCVRLYLLGYLSISVFTTQNFRIKEKYENFF